ncbi:OmpA family protein [Shewanella sp. SNU WT4]|uniref:OmpA family protein n=1 Tax=Shewanella sp. SNU WT4 TaxID=2590015 RepID=UPI00112BFA4B|nr:OmpA family protein [Shewanella sp. SNU WT4]QDF68130.1 OmpA family protein [Shewanella sp. SNU WT4]
MKIWFCGCLLIFLYGCTAWPEHGQGGMAELYSAELYPVNNQQDLGPEQGLRFEWELSGRKLDVLVLQGAELCFPATIVQAELNQKRIVRQLQGGLLYDAATDIIAQRQLLARLEQRLDIATTEGKCILPDTGELAELDAIDNTNLAANNVANELSNLLNHDNQFAVNSYQLNPKFIGNLAKAAAQLTELPQYSLLITGHADDQGSLEYNFQLANARAEQVKRYLMIFGLNGEQISLDSVGEDEPLLKGTQEEVRLTNRRVTIAVIDSELTPAQATSAKKPAKNTRANSKSNSTSNSSSGSTQSYPATPLPPAATLKEDRQ